LCINDNNNLNKYNKLFL